MTDHYTIIHITTVHIVIGHNAIYVRDTQHRICKVKQPNPNPSSCTASTFGASTSHEATHC